MDKAQREKLQTAVDAIEIAEMVILELDPAARRKALSGSDLVIAIWAARECKYRIEAILRQGGEGWQYK